MIVFHGTNKENAISISKLGFESDTHFAIHLEDALEFGGSWVFMVEAMRKDLPPYSVVYMATAMLAEAGCPLLFNLSCSYITQVIYCQLKNRLAGVKTWVVSINTWMKSWAVQRTLGSELSGYWLVLCCLQYHWNSTSLIKAGG